MGTKINTYHNDWVENTFRLIKDSHLLCKGKSNDLQWYGTQLIQYLGKEIDSEISMIYGKLAVKIEDFFYQICHSTPWGFEMGRNLNALRDVLRGETHPINKYFIWYDSHYLYNYDESQFVSILEIFNDVAEELSIYNRNMKLILLFSDEFNFKIENLLRLTRKINIKDLHVVHFEE